MEPSVWCDIDLETIESYTVWKPESLQWALTVNWARLNDIIRTRFADFPVDDLAAAWRSAVAHRQLTDADREGLQSLYAEPIFATPFQITSGGHRITAMRRQGVRWALGQCYLSDVGDTVDELHAYVSDEDQ